MNCVFDWCNFWSNLFSNNLFVGFVSSILAAVFTALSLSLRDKIRNQKKFSKVKGEYLGHGLDTDGRTILKDPESKASIKYEGENRLSITLTHDNGKRTWEGLITMDNEYYGTLGFKYINMPPDKVEFGFKKCIVTDDGEKMLLVGEAPPKQDGEIKYGKEVLIKEKKES